LSIKFMISVFSIFPFSCNFPFYLTLVEVTNRYPAYRANRTEMNRHPVSLATGATDRKLV
jgi:hypothetical protein